VGNCAALLARIIRDRALCGSERTAGVLESRAAIARHVSVKDTSQNGDASALVVQNSTCDGSAKATLVVDESRILDLNCTPVHVVSNHVLPGGVRREDAVCDCYLPAIVIHTGVFFPGVVVKLAGSDREDRAREIDDRPEHASRGRDSNLVQGERSGIRDYGTA